MTRSILQMPFGSTLKKSIGMLFVIVLVFCCAGLAQSESKKSEVKIIDSKPGVFISYDGPKNEPPRTRLLRLHNNMRWNVLVCQYDKPPGATDVIGVHYSLVETPKTIFDPETTTTYADGRVVSSKTPEKVIPRGYPKFDFCDPYELKSGQSILFPVSQDHLIREARLSVDFYYAWENVNEARTGKEPWHSVVFYSQELIRPN